MRTVRPRRRLFPHDPLLYGRLIGLAFAAGWLFYSGAVIAPIALLAMGLLLGATVYSWSAQVRRGRAFTLTDAPIVLVCADLFTASLWTIATAPDPHSVAFGLIIAASALVQFRLGRRGIVVSAIVFAITLLLEQLAVLALGGDVDVGPLLREGIVVCVVLLVTGVVVTSYRGEQDRAWRALRRARLLEESAAAIGTQTDPETVLALIPRHALQLVEADHATLNVHRGNDFQVVAGAGLGGRVVGAHAPSSVGIVGRVVVERNVVEVADYRALADAPERALALGLQTVIAIPVLTHGEIAAVLVVGRTAMRPFDESDRMTLEGFATHASIALANSRRLELARRRERLSRELAGCTADEAIARLAAEAEHSFNADFVVAAELGPDGAPRIVSALGDETLVRDPDGRLRPVLTQLVERREPVTVRDHVLMPDPQGGARMRVHASMAAPVLVADAVVAAFVVGTTDPYRRFDLIDRQGLAGLAELATTALSEAAARRDRERRIERLTVLNDVASRGALVHDPAEIARLAHEMVGALMPYDAFYVARYDDERRLFDFILEADAGRVTRVGEKVQPLGAGPSSRCVLTGEPYVVRAGNDPVESRARSLGDERRVSESAIHVPLRTRGRVVGVLSVQSYAPAAYDPEDVAVLQSFANLIASSFDNAEHHARLRELYLASVKALAAAVDARDPYTRSHSARVSALSRTIAAEMQLPADEVRRVQLSALLHDIGKIGIPDAILNKPTELTPDEWVIMKTHAPLGASILEAVEPLRDLVPIVRSHHERYDGAGYPDGLAGDEIPLGAYIVQAADAYEVIVSKRSYKAAQSVDFAVSELTRYSGTQFHPTVVAAFLRVIERDRRDGSAYLSRVGAMEQEDIEDLPGPGPIVERMAEQSHAHARQLAILQRLASEISAVLDIDELASRLLRIVCDAMGYENGFLSTLDEAGGLGVRAAFGPTVAYIGHPIPAGTGISSWVIQHGRLQNVPDVQADTRYVGPADIRSSLIVPLRIGEETVGVIGIESTRPAAFSDEDETLLTAVSHQVAAAVRVARLHQAAKTAATTDSLTGLPNRRAFFEALARGLARTGAEGAPLSVAVIDANGLKQLNDGCGHAVGDQALMRIGEVLAAGVRDGDLVARIGGDEFAIVFPGASLFVAERVMRRLADEISAATLPGGQAVPTIAWGIAPAPIGARSVDALVDEADRAMYRQKEQGRTRAAS